MKKVGMLMIVIMLSAVVTAAQADVRPGGLPPLNENEMIPNVTVNLMPPPVPSRQWSQRLNLLRLWLLRRRQLPSPSL